MSCYEYFLSKKNENNIVNLEKDELYYVYKENKNKTIERIEYTCGDDDKLLFKNKIDLSNTRTVYRFYDCKFEKELYFCLSSENSSMFLK
jgi:hypothetical protein